MVKFYRSLKDKDFDFDFDFLRKHELGDYGSVETMSDFAKLVFDTMFSTLKSTRFLVQIRDDKMDELTEKINLLHDFPDDREIVSVDVNFLDMQDALELARESGLFREFCLQDNPSNLMVLFTAFYEVIMKHSETRRDLYQIIDLHIYDKKKSSTIDEFETKTDTHADDLTPKEDEDDVLPFNFDAIKQSLGNFGSQFIKIISSPSDETDEEDMTDKQPQPSEASEEYNLKSLEEALEIIIEQELGLTAKVHIYSQKELDVMKKAQDYKEKSKQLIKSTLDKNSQLFKQLKDTLKKSQDHEE